MDAAHSCGRAGDGCVNPRHLRWATRAENMADKLLHGTDNRGERNALAKLNEDDIRSIRAASGREPQAATAKRFDVDQSTISLIQRRLSWGWLE